MAYSDIDKKVLLTGEDLAVGRFIVLILSEVGREYFKNNHIDQREIFYITSKSNGCQVLLQTLPPRVSGKFIFELENDPDSQCELLKSGGFSNGIIFYDGKTEDARIISHDRLTEAEKEDTKNRLVALIEKCPDQTVVIQKMLQDLQNQCDHITIFPKKKTGKKKRV